ncbi:MAG: TPM domain-containing protein [Clostridia bacterium]|nr:TPM domain-containing protein [Clostridia bacterium]
MKSKIRLLICLLLVLCASLACAQAPADGFGGPLLEDEADIFTDEEEALLLESMRLLSGYGRPMLWTNREYGDSGRLANRYCDRYGGTSGAVLMIDMVTREIWISACGPMRKALSPSAARSITDNVYTFATRGDFYACASEAFSQMRTRLEGGRIAEPMRWITSALIAVASALLIVFAAVSARERSGSRLEKGKIIPPVPASVRIGHGFTCRNQEIERKILSSRVIYRGNGVSGGSSGGGRGDDEGWLLALDITLDILGLFLGGGGGRGGHRGGGRRGGGGRFRSGGGGHRF